MTYREPGTELLFVMRSPAYIRNFETVLVALAVSGHRTTVLFEQGKAGGDVGGTAVIERLCAEHSALSFDSAPRPHRSPLGALRLGLRVLGDYLRYFERPYRDPKELRARVLAPLPGALERVLAAALRPAPGLRHAVARAATYLEGRLGHDRAFAAEIDRRSPRLLLLTPLVQLRSRQPDWVRAARARAVPTMLCVHSWDNLTNKGLMHAQPDRVAVWNEVQRREAVELHGADHDSILVCGAWSYEHWLTRRPTRTREQLCRQLGLNNAAPVLLYVGSSPFITRNERRVVADWLGAIRSASDSRLSKASVVIRPHPLNASQWEGWEPPAGATIFPAGGSEPVDEQSRRDYFDSLSAADVVVGINTSALVEAAIIGRPTVALPDSMSAQRELPHFGLIGGSAVIVSVSAEEHLDQLATALRDPQFGAADRRRFADVFTPASESGERPSERVVESALALASPAVPPTP